MILSEKNDAHFIERMFAHELHHAARWNGPGYGSTLGEAFSFREAGRAFFY